MRKTHKTSKSPNWGKPQQVIAPEPVTKLLARALRSKNDKTQQKCWKAAEVAADEWASVEECPDCGLLAGCPHYISREEIIANCIPRALDWNRSKGYLNTREMLCIFWGTAHRQAA